MREIRNTKKFKFSPGRFWETLISVILVRIPLISKAKLSSTVLITLSFPLDIKGTRAKMTDIKISQNPPGGNLNFWIFRKALDFYFSFYFVDSPGLMQRLADYLTLEFGGECYLSFLILFTMVAG